MKPLDPDCGNYCNITHNARCGNHFNSITERLAAYEDTGLMPDEIQRLRDTYAQNPAAALFLLPEFVISFRIY
ncbi:hypothetical protein [Caproiciproducens sp.]|uniref:hypothetical protein n=1 Tax=Caproiciproducens sp. TaxID=1954376 RepID=UPI00289FB79D|nr:hypothetical protein [Caproiciproducens sp.]